MNIGFVKDIIYSLVRGLFCMQNIKEKLFSFIRKEIVLSIAIVCTIVTIFIIPFDREYLNYFEIKTLVSLLCMLIVVSGLKKTNVFDFISKKLISLFKTRRAIIYALVFGTFFFDMIVANDMSLITFLPLTYIILHSTDNDKYLGITFILQTVAANMGGMVTPYGNPQNLYLFSYFNIPVREFFGILFVQFIAIILLLCLSGVFIPNASLSIRNDDVIDINKKRLYVYIVLFFMVI